MKHFTNGSQLWFIAICLARATLSHEHHAHNIPKGEHVSAAPIDVTLWLHIFIQTVTWMLIFPTGIVLGVARSRWHVPVQTVGFVCAIIGHFLGHGHGGREFRSNAHGQLASFVTNWLAVQILCGVYLKLHLEHRYWVRIRRTVIAAHAVLGIGMPLVSWFQVMLGGVTALGFCHGSHTGQCVVHAVSGSALIGVGVLLLFIQQCERYRLTAPFANSDAVQATLVNMSGVLVVLADWISKETHQRAILDLVITGLVYLCVHAFITWLAWMSDSQILRKASSGVLLVIGGWFLATHSTLPAPSILHKFLGFSMQTAGVAQILVAGFTGTSKESAAAMTKEIYLLRLLTAYSLGASGLLFIGANKEQLQLLSSGSMPSTPFILLMYSATLLLFSSVSFLMYMLSRCSTNGITKAEQSPEEVQAGSGHLLHIRNYNLSHLVDIALV